MTVLHVLVIQLAYACMDSNWIRVSHHVYIYSLIPCNSVYKHSQHVCSADRDLSVLVCVVCMCVCAEVTEVYDTMSFYLL